LDGKYEVSAVTPECVIAMQSSHVEKPGRIEPDNPTPTGSVVFRNGTATIETGTLSGGKATLSYSALSKGTRSITAAYGANTNFNSHTSERVRKTVR
jgi:hypothetical protein